MDRDLDVNRTRFVIPEIFIGSHMLDKIQSDKFDLVVKDSQPSSITFRFEITMSPTIIDGRADLEYFQSKSSEFTYLVLKNEHAIGQLVKYFNANSKWNKYPRMVRFDFGSGDSRIFKAAVSKKSDHELHITRI